MAKQQKVNKFNQTFHHNNVFFFLLDKVGKMQHAPEQRHKNKPVKTEKGEVLQYLGECERLVLVARVLVAVVSGSPYKGAEGRATSGVT